MENNLVKLEPCPFCGCRDRRVGIRRMGRESTGAVFPADVQWKVENGDRD